MTFDQQIQVWSAAGSWLAGFATLLAVALSLWLVRRQDSVKLNVNAACLQLFAGDGTPPRNIVGISVTNLGERPVIINSVGWRIGRGKKRRFCLQTVGEGSPDDYPKAIGHGQSANFWITRPEVWAEEIGNKFIESLTDWHLKTFIVQVHTSVGQTVEKRASESILKLLKEHIKPGSYTESDDA
jgi:hypothetical protein